MSGDPFGGASTYVDDYKKYSQAPRAAIKPDNTAYQSSEPFPDKTGYRDDYIRHNLPTKFHKPKDEYSPNKVPLENMTTSKRDFTPKDLEKARSFKPDGAGYRSDAPFDDDTTNKNDYKRWDVKPNFVKRDNDWKPPLGEMETSTNYNREFTNKPAQRAQAIVPAHRQKVDAKFDGDTTYNQDFRKWAGGRPDAAKMGGEYQTPTVPFEGLSTYKGHFNTPGGGPAQSFKPDGMAYKSDAPFDGHTLYRTEFTPKEIEPCPTTLLETKKSNLVFHSEDQHGHKFYQKTAPKSVIAQ